MLLKTLGKKKTESEYEKYIARVACSFFSLGILGLFIVRSNSLSDYALGLVMGVTIGSYPCCVHDSAGGPILQKEPPQGGSQL